MHPPSSPGSTTFGSCDGCTRKDTTLYPFKNNWLCLPCYQSRWPYLPHAQRRALVRDRLSYEHTLRTTPPCPCTPPSPLPSSSSTSARAGP